MMTLNKRIFLIFFAMLFSLALVTAGLAAASGSLDRALPQADPIDDETQSEQDKASTSAPESVTTLSTSNAVGYALFVGVDDSTVPAYLFDPTLDASIQAFVGTGVWGAAYDYANQRVLFSSGTSLYEWPVGGSVNLLGTITDQTDNPFRMVGLAFYDGTLYGTSDLGAEAVYIIDITALEATAYIDYTDDSYQFYGLAADPLTGELYALNNDSSPYGVGLFKINLDGTATLIDGYPGSELDLDGLAIDRDGHAYLVPDQPGIIYVYDFSSDSYTTNTAPWTTEETQVGSAWIYFSDISLHKTVGLDANTCAESDTAYAAPGSQVTYCYTVENTGNVTLTMHTLEDSQLGTLLLDHPYELAPGSTYSFTQIQVVTATVVNTATWTAYDMGASDLVTATDTATVYSWPTACPAGYEPVVVASADFEDFPPLGWTITNDTTDCLPSIVPEWTNTDPVGRGNLTGGSGKFAIADSDACGSDSVMNTTMTSAALNFSGLISPTITFYTDYNDISIFEDDIANFDVSVDGGLTWQNIFSWNADVRGPMQVGTELTGDGEEDVRVRWDYKNATWDWWWEVDDVLIAACGQVPHIEASPEEISSTQVKDQVLTHTLTISNVGTAALDWMIFEEDPHSLPLYDQGIDGVIQSTSDITDTCYPADLPWLELSPITGTLDIELSQGVDVTFNAADLLPDDYSGYLCIQSNDPDQPVLRVPLTLTVVLGADLTLTKTASKAVVDPGETIEYTLVVENSGPDPAHNATLVDTLPAGVTFVSASAGCSHVAGVVTCNLGTQAVGEVTEVRIVVMAWQDEGVLTNNASVSADELDIYLADNSASAQTRIWSYVYLPMVMKP
jgi:uncharacterized repeat protein (TIGR01451 family)